MAILCSGPESEGRREGEVSQVEEGSQVLTGGGQPASRTLGGRLSLAQVMAGAGVAPDSRGASSTADCGPRTSGLTALFIQVSPPGERPRKPATQVSFSPEKHRPVSG